MINIGNDVFDYVAKKTRAKHPGTDICSPYVRKPSDFPAVTIAQRSNRVAERYSTDIPENAAFVMIEAQIFSNKSSGREMEAWGIAETVDGAFAEIGFTRKQLEPVENLNDSTIYRIVSRYEAVVIPNDNGKFYIYRN